MARSLEWYRVQILIGGLVPREMSTDMEAVRDELEGRDFLRSVSVGMDYPNGRAIISAEIEVYHPDDAIALVEEEVLRVILMVRSLDDVYVEPIGASTCDNCSGFLQP
jgi:hypothetical protein